MKWLITLFIIAHIDLCFGQPWVEYYDHGTSDKFRRLRATSDGGYVLCGSQGGAAGQAWVLKVDQDGGEEWSQILSGAGEAFDIQEVSGGYILTGGKANTDAGDSLSIWRLDDIGELIWGKRHAPVDPKNLGRSILPLSEGGYIISGRTGIGALIHDLLLMKVDEAGEMEWYSAIDLGGLDEAIQLVEHPDGGFLVLTTTSAEGMYHAPVLLRTDQNGDALWTMPLGSGEVDIAHQMILTSAPGVLVVGRTAPAFGQPGDVWLEHRDLDGTLIWMNSIGSSTSDETGYDVGELPDGGYTIAVHGETVGWVRVDAQGQFLAEGGADVGAALNIVGLVYHDDGSIVMAGNVVTDTTYTSFHTDGFLLKTGFDGAMNIESLPTHSTVLFPNPTVGVFYIESDLSSAMQIEISDQLGRKVLDREYTLGHAISVEGVAPGLYILNLVSGGEVIGSHRLMIQR